MIRLDALALRPQGSGVQTYVRALLGALPTAWPEARFVATVERSAAAMVPAGIEVDAVRIPFDHGVVRKACAHWRSGPSSSLVHGLDTDLPRSAGGAATVVTVHDLALFDVPWAFREPVRVVKAAAVASAIRRADVVISVSTFTAERVAARFGRTSVIVHEAAAPGFGVPDAAAVRAVRERHSLPERFVLYVGNLEPRKDVPTLAAACRAAGLPLVVAGGALRRGTRLDPSTVELGYVDAAELPALYAAATVVGYVPRYEGFGLPPVEAMACGAAVVATRVGALPEIAGEGIEFVAVGDVDDQARAITRLAADAALADHRRRSAIAAAGALSWGAAALGHTEVYRSLLGTDH